MQLLNILKRFDSAYVLILKFSLWSFYGLLSTRFYVFCVQCFPILETCMAVASFLSSLS